jgi:hypothetical protein
MKKRLQFITYCFFIIIISQAEYCSKVPLSNKINIDPNLIGEWKFCSENNCEYYYVAKLNSSEYVIVREEYSKEEKKWVKANPATCFLSKIKGTLFINYLESGKYVIKKISIKFNSLILYGLNEKYFTDSNSTSLEFDNASDLTDYVQYMMDQSDFYDEPQYFYKIS